MTNTKDESLDDNELKFVNNYHFLVAFWGKKISLYKT